MVKDKMSKQEDKINKEKDNMGEEFNTPPPAHWPKQEKDIWKGRHMIEENGYCRTCSHNPCKQGKEFKTLSEEIIYGISCGDVILVENIKEFIKILIQASEDNDWEVAINDGDKEGFRVISGKEFIENKLGANLT